MKIIIASLFALIILASPASAQWREDEYYCEYGGVTGSVYAVRCGAVERELAIKREMEILPSAPAYVVGFIKNAVACGYDKLTAAKECMKDRVKDYFSAHGVDPRVDIAKYTPPPGVRGVRIDINPQGYRNDSLKPDDVLKLLKKPGS